MRFFRDRLLLAVMLKFFRTPCILLLVLTLVTTAAMAGDEPVTPPPLEPASGLMVFISSSGDLDKDISATTVPLAKAAMQAATTKHVGRAARDITVGMGYRQLLKYVGGADKDDVLIQEGVILCRLWTTSDGKGTVTSPIEKFKILPGKDPKTGKKLTAQDVETAALAYLDKTAEPPPGTLAAVTLAKEQAELVANNGKPATQAPPRLTANVQK